MALRADISSLQLSARVEKFAGDCPPSEPVTVVNSNESFSQSINPGGELVLIDTVAKNSAGTTVGTAPYNQIVTIGDSVILKANGITELATLAAEGSLTTTQIIDLMTAAEVLADVNTAGLMQDLVQSLTGGSGNLSHLTQAQLQGLLQSQLQLLSDSQLLTLSDAQKQYIFEQLPVTSYDRVMSTDAVQTADLYDDYWVRTNVYTNTPTRKTNKLVPGSQTTLVYNNSFGNKNRFTDILGGQNYAALSFYLLDNYHGNGFYLQARPAATWQTAVAEYATFSLVVNGQTLTGFFLLDHNIQNSIRKHSLTHSLNYAPFVNTNNALWTSTPDPLNTTRAIYITSSSTTEFAAKNTLTLRYVLGRRHFIN